MIFRTPIVDENGMDYRRLPAVLQIMSGVANDPQLQHINGVISIQLLNSIMNPPILKSLTDGVTALKLDVDGIYYHPRRHKWVIYQGASCSNRFMDTQTHILSSTLNQQESNLKIRFPANEYEIVDLNNIKVKADQIPHFDYMQKNSDIIPIQAHYIDLIDLSRQPNFRMNGNACIISLYLLGLSEALEISYEQDRTFKVNAEAFVEVWPNLPNWKTYWVNACISSIDPTTRQPIQFEQWQSRFYTYHHENHMIEEIHMENRDDSIQIPFQTAIQKNVINSVAIRSWPHLILLTNAAGSLSCLIYNRDLFSISDSPLDHARIGFDFGSARSVVCIAPDIGENSFNHFIQHFPEHKQLPMFSHRGKSLIDGIKSKRKGDHYLSVVTGDQEYQTLYNHHLSRNSTIKFLILESKIKTLTDYALGAQDRTMPLSATSLSVLASEFQTNINTSLKNVDKWNESHHNPNWRAFFKNILLLSMAEFWSIYKPETVAYIAASSPLAFTQNHHLKYAEDFKAALDWFFTEIAPAKANYSWFRGNILENRVNQSGTFPESIAAYSALKTAHVSNDILDQMVLVADLGGGTLDLSVWLRPLEGQVSMLLSDSTELGANAIMKKLQNKDVNILERHIYMKGGGYGALKNRIPPVIKETFDQILKNWQDLLVEYVTRAMLGCYLSKMDKTKQYHVIVLLVGGGWKTFEFTSDMNTLANLIQNKIKEVALRLKSDQTLCNTLQVDARLLDLGLEKVAIAGGLHAVSQINNAKYGLFAPNGIDEKNQSTIIHWHTYVDHQQDWLGIQPHYIEKNVNQNVVLDLLPKIDISYTPEKVTFSNSDLGYLNGLMKNYTENGKRKITYAALAFKEILKKL